MGQSQAEMQKFLGSAWNRTRLKTSGSGLLKACEVLKLSGAFCFQMACLNGSLDFCYLLMNVSSILPEEQNILKKPWESKPRLFADSLNICRLVSRLPKPRGASKWRFGSSSASEKGGNQDGRLDGVENDKRWLVTGWLKPKISNN